jgi:hypothetical protein
MISIRLLQLHNLRKQCCIPLVCRQIETHNPKIQLNLITDISVSENKEKMHFSRRLQENSCKISRLRASLSNVALQKLFRPPMSENYIPPAPKSREINEFGDFMYTVHNTLFFGKILRQFRLHCVCRSKKSVAGTPIFQTIEWSPENAPCPFVRDGRSRTENRHTVHLI